MDSKIGCYQKLAKLSDSVTLAKDNTGAKRILKQYESTSAWSLSQCDTKVLMKLQHNNLLPPLDIFTEEGYRYVVYEYCDWYNLGNYILRKGKLTEKQIFNISMQIVTAYQFIKDNGQIHGNINPTNILINEDEELKIKLTDFLIYSKKQEDLLSNEFIAPEITSGKIKPNVTSDIYSMGSVMKLLLESSESYTNIYTKLIEDCLEIDIDKRIKFDIFILHPYFTSTYPIYKPFRGSL